ncbi:MAG: signal peptidase II [Chloroflexi bacterium]|nr:signal peptidase II [Chloroflexota bacterium]
MDTPDAAPETGGSTPPHRALHRWAFWGAAVAVIAADQATKTIIRTTMDRGDIWPSDDWPVRIKYVTNTGAAFGVLQDQAAFLIIMAFIGLAAIYVYYRYPPFQHWLATLAIGLMLGGAAGNLIDRVLQGRVTDFIDFPRFPAFNVADSSITVGVAIVLIGYFLLEARKEAPAPADAES